MTAPGDEVLPRGGGAAAARPALALRLPASLRDSLDWPVFVGLSLILGMVIAAPVAALPILALAAVWAMWSAAGAAQALWISWLLGFLNPGLAAVPGAAAGLRWLILAAAALRVVLDLLRGQGRLPWSVVGVIVFAAIAGSASMLVSPAPGVSMAKLVSFAVGGVTVLASVWNSGIDQPRWDRLVRTVWAVVICWSAPLLLSGVGRLLNSYGFQGIFSQPQAFGIFIAPVAAWATGRFVDGSRDPASLALAIGTWGLLFASASRTALFAVVLGLALAWLVAAVFSREFRKRLWVALGRARTWGWIAIGAAALAGIAVGFSGLLIDFLLKQQTVPLDAEVLTLSRMALILGSLDNFRAHPLTGIGFGIPTDPSRLAVARDPVFGLPISAPVEKGFLGSALLEEVGIVGTVAFVAMIAALVPPLLRRRSLTPLWIFFAALSTNLGEVTVFSFAGVGLYVWLLMVAPRRAPDDVAEPGSVTALTSPG